MAFIEMDFASGGTSTPAQLLEFYFEGTYSTAQATQTYTAERSGVLHFTYGNHSTGVSGLSINGTAKTPIGSYGNSSRYQYIGYYQENVNRGDTITITQHGSGGVNIYNLGVIADV